MGGVAGSFQARRLGPRLETTLISTGVEATQHRAYVQHFYKHDPHLVHIKSLPVGRSQLSRDVLSDAALVRTEMYNDFCLPQRLHDLQGVVLMRDDLWAVSLAMYSHDRYRFDANTQQRLDAAVPHLRRSLTASAHFGGARTTEPVLRAAAEAGALTLLWVDESLQLVDARESTQSAAWLRGGVDALRIERGKLWAKSLSDQDLLAAGVQQALSNQSSTVVLGRGTDALSVTFALGPRISPIARERAQPSSSCAWAA